MKRFLCSYGNEPYYGSLSYLGKTAMEKGGIDEFLPYTRDIIEPTEFYRKNRYILDKPRGNGYWMWKPYIILDSFSMMEEGDVVMYTDAAMEFISDASVLYNITNDKGRMLFVLPGNHLNRTWTKRDCFVLMNCDATRYYDSVQTQGAVSLWQKNEANVVLLTEWLKVMRDPRIVTDDPNFCGQNLPEFKDHRHDQSVLSLLTVKYDIERFRDPTQWGNDELPMENSPYAQILNHHRKKL